LAGSAELSLCVSVLPEARWAVAAEVTLNFTFHFQLPNVMGRYTLPELCLGQSSRACLAVFIYLNLI